MQRRREEEEVGGVLPVLLFGQCHLHTPLARQPLGRLDGRLESGLTTLFEATCSNNSCLLRALARLLSGQDTKRLSSNGNCQPTGYVRWQSLQLASWQSTLGRPTAA